MDFVSPLLGVIKDYLVEPITRHVLYAFQMKTKIDNLRDELSGLSAIEKDVGRKVDAARAKLQTPFSLVTTWQEKVKTLKQEIGRDIDMELRTIQITNQCSPNFISRYKLGKQATQHLLLVKALKDDGKGFVTGTVVDPNLPSPAEANYADLGEEVNTLTCLEADVVSVVDNAKRVRGLQPNHQVQGWLLTVANHKLDAKSICDEFQRLKEQVDLERNNWVTISVNLQRTLQKTKALIIEGRIFTSDNNAVDPSRPLLVVEQSKIPTIGQEQACADVLKLIEDDDVRLIGIYGMGGVGKTTILKRVNNSLEGMAYDIIIFVVVSGTMSIEGIQRDILKRLGSNLEGTSSMERESKIRNFLDGKKFVLMLDDVWTELDLDEVGIPNYTSQENYKILFTTRDESVCDKMKAKKVKIECLNNEEAWKLFETTVGDAITNSNTQIRKICELVAKECGGLPLALTVIGGAMRGKRTISEWSNALSTLRKFEPELTGTLNKLYMRLKFSYESLPNSIVRECFCYCALFPEDWVIDTYSLVECWIGEGFFAECESIENARNKGYAIIADLIRACLLEGIEKNSKSEYESVKMHDVVRDMAQWIKKDKFVVFTEGSKALKFDKWDKVERLNLTTCAALANFLMHGIVKFRNLSTLLLKYDCLKMMRDDFFLSMPSLKVLQVYDAKIYHGFKNYSWPSSTWSLTQLRYADFGGKAIPHSREMGTLVSLEILKVIIQSYRPDVEHIISLEGVIPRLCYLRVLHISIEFSLGLEELGVKISDLKALAHLEDLKLPVSTISYLMELAACPKLAHCVSSLCLIYLDMKLCRLSLEIGSMDRLEQIKFEYCQFLEEIMIEEDVGSSQNFLQNLKSLQIMRCPKLRTLYLNRTLPQLEEIEVHSCESIHLLLTSRDGTTPYVFPELQVISLLNNRGAGLEYICSDTFSFPRLKILTVWDCIQLRRLPKGIIEARNKQLQKIKGERKWWERLEWDAEEDKMSLFPFLEFW